MKFRIIENDNDSGWVEKLSNVGSEGTDVLVKAMLNIMLLNVFKESASKKFKDFRLHCMMDEIGKLHPNNVRGILQFARDRDIRVISGSPIENWLGQFYRRIKSRKGPLTAAKATARKLAIIFYEMLKYRREFIPVPMETYNKQYKEYRLKQLNKQTALMGYELTPCNFVS